MGRFVRAFPFILFVFTVLAASVSHGHCGDGTAKLNAVPGKATLRFGHLAFPTSARRPEAQKAFVDGVLLLHAFLYYEAREKFREARRLEPGFAMATWGEAVAYTYLLWGQEDFAEGRRALEALAPTAAERERAAPTEREKLYLRAVEALYREAPRERRLKRFAEAMAIVAKRYPSDLEARSFSALAQLALVNPEEFGYQRRGRRILKPVVDDLFAVVAAAPAHPGALHYLIHALDTPALASRAIAYLDALKASAPDASHLAHMPTHISLRLGNWDQSIAFNTDAFFNVSGQTDFHALAYLHYAYLQKGPSRKDEADKALAVIAAAAAKESATKNPGLHLLFGEMKARQAVEWEEWSLLEGSVPAAIPYPQNHPWRDEVVVSQLFAVGRAALARGERGLLRQAIEALDVVAVKAQERSQLALAKGQPGEAERERNSVQLATLTTYQLRALEASAREDVPAMIRALEHAATLEDRLGPPPARLPYPIIPSHELSAELLFKHRQGNQRVTKQLDVVDRWHRKRRRSLLLREALDRP